MKNIILCCGLATVLFVASCKKDNTGNQNYLVNLAFWTAANCSPNPINVTVNNQTQTITEYFPASVPGCGTSGCANFYLAAGTYNYTANNIDTSWQGSVTVSSSGCNRVQLFCSTGNVTFWVDSAANNTSVMMDNGTGHIATAFPTTTPACGTTGCANFTLHPGNYTYVATTSNNIGYTGSVTVRNDSCILIKLY